MGLLGACAMAGGAPAAVATGSSGAHMTVITSGLDNPRDLAFSPAGRLYVAEAGHGGSQCVSGGEEGEACFGFTSGVSVVQILRHSHYRIVSGVVSTAGKDGFGATGVDGISALGHGKVYGIVTGSRDSVPAGTFSSSTFEAHVKAQLGRLFKRSDASAWHPIADVGHADWVWTSQHKNLVPGQFPDANPYGVLAYPETRWVVDAGANTLDRVVDGHVQIAAFFPNPVASDAVPTCIERGPDGALYIAELTGGGNPPGSARVWRFQPGAAHPLTMWASGLTAVTGCGFDKQGRFYAVEFSTLGLENAAPNTGALVRVPAHSTHPVTVIDGLSFPGGFAAAPDGSLYLSNWSIAPANSGGGPTGQVVRVTL